MIMVNNPFGLDPMDIENEASTYRIGSRIKKIRSEKGISQAELAEMVGISTDRLQKYENGIRKAKTEMLKSISAALGVSTLALVDPNTTSYIGAMYAFFEMEEHFNMTIKETKEGRFPGICLHVDFRDELYKYMEEWYKIYNATQAELYAATSQEERVAIIKAYHDWEWNFPKSIVDRTTKEMKKKRIKEKIEELQEAYDILDDEFEK